MWLHSFVDFYKTNSKVKGEEATQATITSCILAPSVVPACCLGVTISLPAGMLSNWIEHN